MKTSWRDLHYGKNVILMREVVARIHKKETNPKKVAIIHMNPCVMKPKPIKNSNTDTQKIV